MAKKQKKSRIKAFVMIGVCIAVFSFMTFMTEVPVPQNDEPVISEQRNIEAETEMIFIEPQETTAQEEASVAEVEEEEYVFELSYPVDGEIIEKFSEDELVYSRTLGDWRVHNGIDIKAELLERVYASERGIVERVYEDALMGKTIVIDHQNGFKTVYSNLSSTEMVDNGEFIEKGTIISGVGDSALAESSQEPHIHFQVIKDDVTVNPEDFIK